MLRTLMLVLNVHTVFVKLQVQSLNNRVTFFLYLQARDLLKIFKIKPTTFINYMTSVEVRKDTDSNHCHDNKFNLRSLTFFKKLFVFS